MVKVIAMAGRPRGSTNVYPSDTQRERLYLAERELPEFDALDFENLAEVKRFVARFIKRKAWTSRTQVERIMVHSSSRTWAKGYHIGYTGELDLPKWAWNKLIIAHELAHVMTPPLYGRRAIHSREFAGTYLYLVGKICGQDVKDRLIQSFFKHKVDWDGRLAS